MIQYERQNEILALLENKNAISIHKLASILHVSEATVRRDVQVLEKSGVAQRVYGGVILTKYLNSNLPRSMREQENKDKKRALCKEAAKLVKKGDVIMLDAASTTQMITDYIRTIPGITVVTNCIDIVSRLAGSDVRVYCTGGEYIENSNAFAGRYAEQMICDITADILFFSSKGLGLDGVITDGSDPETKLRQTMLKNAKKKVFLCDSSKIGSRLMFKVCTVKDVDLVICDKPLPKQICKFMQK